VAELTGIDQAGSRRLAGRFDVSEFRRELDRRNGKVRGRYDASVSGFDPIRTRVPIISTIHPANLDRTIDQRRGRPHQAQAQLETGRTLRAAQSRVERSWDFGRGRNPPESISQLREILASDPKLKLLVGHGLFDLATPYFGTKNLARPLPAYASPERVRLVVYPGGHMFYLRDASRQAFRAEAEALMK